MGFRGLGFRGLGFRGLGFRVSGPGAGQCAGLLEGFLSMVSRA